MNELPKNFNLEDLNIGDSHNFVFKINLKMMIDFQNISGDLNPLHNDSEFAKSKGFKDKVVYGGLLISQISKMLGMYMPGKDSVWTHIDISFLKPFYIEEKGKLVTTIKNISFSTNTIDLQIKIFSISDNILKVRGKASAMIIGAK